MHAGLLSLCRRTCLAAMQVHAPADASAFVPTSAPPQLLCSLQTQDPVAYLGFFKSRCVVNRSVTKGTPYLTLRNVPIRKRSFSFSRCTGFLTYAVTP